MWSPCLRLLLAALAAASISAAPSPLSTSATTSATLSGLGEHSGRAQDEGLLIHVLRTEDLIADKLATKPLLLERLSHLLIRIQLDKQSVAVNGHTLPVLPGAEPLHVNVKLKQVQMLKMPKDSPLVPLALSPPELLSIADKYMSEGIVAAILSVSQEPLLVEAIRADESPVQAEAYKVTIAIKILEVEGMSLAETELPAVDLLHLIVHPDQADPSKVATMTTLAPEALSAPADPGAPLLGSTSPSPAAILGAALDTTRASLVSTLQALGSAMRGMAAHATGLLHGPRPRKPCHHHHHHHHHHHKEAKPTTAHLAAVPPTPSTQPLASFRHRLQCLAKTLARSSLLLLFLLAIPFLLLLLALSSTLLRSRLQTRLVPAPPAYVALPLNDDKLFLGHHSLDIHHPSDPLKL